MSVVHASYVQWFGVLIVPEQRPFLPFVQSASVAHVSPGRLGPS
jgi:hypothetical protein